MNFKYFVDHGLNYGRHLIRRYLAHSSPLVNVLDIGAGHGDDLSFAKLINPSVKLFAIESYPPYALELKEKGIETFDINIERDKFPFEDKSMDVIVINQVFEHVKEVFWILNEITRVLKVGGHLIVGVPNLASFHNRFLLLFGQQPTSIQNYSAHVRGYTLNDFCKLLNSGFPNGYELISNGGANFYPFPPIVAKPLATIFPKMAYGLFMHFKKTKEYNFLDGYLEYVQKSKLETNFFLGSQISNSH